MTKKPSKQPEIVITLGRLLNAVATVDPTVPAPFSILRKQPVPVATGLKLIEMGKILQGHGENYNQAVADLRERHNVNGQPNEAFSKDLVELLNQEIKLPFERLPKALISEARMSTDDLQSLLWLFE